MPKMKKKCKSYNNDDCYNLEKVQEDAKKIKSKDEIHQKIRNI